MEGESPSFGFCVVFFEHIDLFSSKILPLGDWFFDPFGLGNSLSEEFKEGGFSTSDVAFDGETVVVGLGFGVDEVFRENLILISR